MEGGRDFSTDVLVEILQRLTPIPRRRLRLVCRHWRDTIDEAYAGDRETQNRSAKPLFLSYINNTGQHCTARAYVVDDLAGGGLTEVWNSGAVPHHGGIGIVGTCNGILCLSENLKQGGTVSLVNPATGETLAIPPLPYFSRQPRYGISIWLWHELYSFMYRHTTGQYKIVHVPCYLDRTCEFHTVQVFTLGEASWRDVPVSPSSCDIGSGLVNISSVLYWVTKGTEKVMSFDLEDERVTQVNSLPVPAVSGYSCRLTMLRGTLGAAITVRSPTLEKIEVWILEGKKEKFSWSRRCNVQVHGLQQELAKPHFSHGEYLLTQGSSSDRQSTTLYGHKLSDARRLQCSDVRISEKKQGTVLGNAEAYLHRMRTFPYIETAEPLAIYRSGEVVHYGRAVLCRVGAQNTAEALFYIYDPHGKPSTQKVELAWAAVPGRALPLATVGKEQRELRLRPRDKTAQASLLRLHPPMGSSYPFRSDDPLLNRASVLPVSIARGRMAGDIVL